MQYVAGLLFLMGGKAAGFGGGGGVNGSLLLGF